MILITLSGTDGSGKSTQLSLLRERFEQNGKKVAYFHAVSFSLANRLARILKGKRATTEPGSEKANVSASPFSVLLRVSVLFADLAMFRSYLSSLRRKGYDVLLSDRYFYDTAINIRYLSRKRSSEYVPPLVGFMLGIAEKCIVRPDLALFLDANPEAVMRRKRAPEQGETYLAEKRTLFHENADRWNLVPVDADREISEVSALIKEKTKRILPDT